LGACDLDRDLGGSTNLGTISPDWLQAPSDSRNPLPYGY
jgi:hypothetical protein